MLVVRNIGALMTGEPSPHDPLGVIPDAALIAEEDRVTWCGPQEEMGSVPATAEIIDAAGGAVLPGFIDCHTHLLHTGDRSQEFAARARGKTYLEIAAEGGGILASVAAVRASSEEELIEAALPRLRRTLDRGITTIEIKSGYGLSLDAELKMLRALRTLGTRQPVEIVPTFLGAHSIPAEHRAAPDVYVTAIAEKMIPEIAAQQLAVSCDIYVESGAFSVEQARLILGAAREAGLDLKLHTDQFTAQGGCALAAELGARSVDHLEASGPEDIATIAGAGIVAVVTPLCEIYLGSGGPAPGRALADAGVRVAVATDYNPGSANCDDLFLAATVSVTRCGLTVEEALLGITRYAADALGRSDLGRLRTGTRCDLVVLDTPNPLRVVTDMGANHVSRVVKGGALIHQRRDG